MIEPVQVEKGHYEFRRYMTMARWASIWHQIDEVAQLHPANVLEVGPGPGVFSRIASMAGLMVETLDIDPDLKPDHIGSATNIPCADDSYDVVCAFQVLEHLPYCSSLVAFREMARVSRRNVVISLPDAQVVWRYKGHVPRMRSFDVLLSHPLARAQAHTFDGEHYWEINKEGYALESVVHDLGSICRLLKTYRVLENPYHRFFVFQS